MRPTRRNLLLGTAAIALTAPFVLHRGARAQGQTVKIGTVLAGTTMAAQLLPKYLKEVGITADVVAFTNLTQLMQAIASGDIQLGYGGINAAINIAGRGVPLVLLSNACDGGWRLVGKTDIKDLSGLKGKKVAVQAGNMCHVALAWKLNDLGMTKDVELVFMSNNDMPTPMQQGQVDAIFGIEPYPTFAVANGWAHEIWRGYDTPVGRVNLGFVGSSTYVESNPAVAKEVLKAHDKGTKELQGNAAIAAEFTANFLNMKRAIVDEALKNMYFSTDTGGDFVAKVKTLGDMMMTAKMTTKLPDWNSFIKTDLLKA
jgi:ABC-type nitrate/sulfonate/bicarbonate transport system substrate-binding protein